MLLTPMPFSIPLVSSLSIPASIPDLYIFFVCEGERELNTVQVVLDLQQSRHTIFRVTTVTPTHT